MSFFHATSAAAARSRRTKEREGHPRASSTNNAGRRHGTGSKSQDNRSPPSKSPVLQSSLYTQQNLALEQVTGISMNATEPASSAPISPTSSIHQSIAQRGGVFHLSQQPYTPIALQQYLDEDQDDKEDDADDSETLMSKETEKVASTSATTTTPAWDAEYSAAEKFYSLPIQNQDGKAEPSITKSRTTRDTARPVSGIGFPDSWKTHDKPSHNVPRNSTAYSGATTTIVQQPDKDNELSEQETVSNTTRIEAGRVVEPEDRSNAKHKNEPAGSGSRTPSLSGVVPYMTASTELKTPSHEATEHQANMVRVTSHQSAPYISRTFTPPAPPTGSSRARAQTPPVFASPIPTRSRMGGNSFVAPYANPTHPQSHQLLQNSMMSETYQGYPVFQDFTEFPSIPYAIPPPMYANATGMPQAAAKSEVQAMQSQLQEDQLEHPFMLISRVLSTLPELQRFIVHCQQSGLDGGYSSLVPNSSNQQNSTQVSSRQLEEKAEDTERQHKEEILTLNQRIAELQVKLDYVETDMARRKKSRDDLHAELITHRVESASAFKLLLDERDNMQKRHNDEYIVAEKEVKVQLQFLHDEIDKGNDQRDELRLQVGELRAAYLAKETEIVHVFERRHDELSETHKDIVHNITNQLENEAIQSQKLARQLEELEQTHHHKRSQLEEQFELHKTTMTRSFDEETAALKDEIKAESARANRSLEDNTKLARELNDARSMAATDRAKFQAMIQGLRDAASKFDMENVSWSTIPTV